MHILVCRAKRASQSEESLSTVENCKLIWHFVVCIAASKAMLQMTVLGNMHVARLFYVLPGVIFVLVFFSPFSIVITSFGEERASLGDFRTVVRFALVWFCLFPLPLGVWEGLRFVIVAVLGLFSYLFFLDQTDIFRSILFACVLKFFCMLYFGRAMQNPLNFSLTFLGHMRTAKAQIKLCTHAV